MEITIASSPNGQFREVLFTDHETGEQACSGYLNIAERVALAHRLLEVSCELLRSVGQPEPMGKTRAELDAGYARFEQGLKEDAA